MKNKENIDISIIIVCMNNIKNITTCVDSIFKHTNKNITLDIIVIAYLFNKDNLKFLQDKYKNITIIPNNKTTGFSENNNIGLQYVKGKYTLILNDDTLFVDDSISELFKEIENNQECSAIYPTILNKDNSIQANQREIYSFTEWLRTIFKFKRRAFITPKGSPYETSGLWGCCFLIQTDLFKQLGYFDEYYFFSPEDIALGKELSINNRKIFVQPKAKVYHLYSVTARPLHSSILPVTQHGFYYYFKKYHSSQTALLVRIISFLSSIFKLTTWILKRQSDRRNIMLKAHFNIIKYAFVKITPKKLFIKLHKKDVA